MLVLVLVYQYGDMVIVCLASLGTDICFTICIDFKMGQVLDIRYVESFVENMIHCYLVSRCVVEKVSVT